MSRLFLRKSVQDCENDIAERGGLRRSLGKWHLTALGVGATIGAGIFATTGTAIVGDAVRPGAGPAIIVSFLLTAVTCGFAALCYAEFASMVPISGSAYTYAYASLGELVAWIIGWDLIVEYAVGNIGVAIGWSGYFRELLTHFGLALPPWLATDFRTAAMAAEATFGQDRVVFGSDWPFPMGLVEPHAQLASFEPQRRRRYFTTNANGLAGRIGT